MIEVVVAGELYADLIMGGFDFWPQPGQEAFAKEFRREIGGGAAITACGLATLGSATALFGIVGSDSQDGSRSASRPGEWTPRCSARTRMNRRHSP
jgi:sugar/nucleoside kinase (ribokinase family)